MFAAVMAIALSSCGEKKQSADELIKGRWVSYEAVMQTGTVVNTEHGTMIEPIAFTFRDDGKVRMEINGRVFVDSYTMIGDNHFVVQMGVHEETFALTVVNNDTIAVKFDGVLVRMARAKSAD